MEITIKTITNKTSKTGTSFWVVDAVEGKYTVWDKDISDQLYTKLGQKVDVDIKVSGDYQNIRGINGGNIEVNFGNAESQSNQIVAEEPQDIRVAGDVPSKDKSIIAQCLTKIVWRNRMDPVTPEDVLGTYKHILKEL